MCNLFQVSANDALSQTPQSLTKGAVSGATGRQNLILIAGQAIACLSRMSGCGVENSIVCQCLFWPAPGFSSLIVGVGLFGNFFLLGVRLLLGFDVSQFFFVESLILAQDERWRRA